MMDPVSALSILPLSILEALEILRDRAAAKGNWIWRQRIWSDYRFHSSSHLLPHHKCSYIFSSTVWKAVDSQALSFALRVSRVSYGRLERQKSAYKRIWISFQKDEAYFSEAFQKDEPYFSEEFFFDELMEDGEVILARPQGVPLLNWEALQGPAEKSDEKASTSLILLDLRIRWSSIK